jgi:hypothetical protein
MSVERRGGPIAKRHPAYRRLAVMGKAYMMPAYRNVSV